MADILIKGLELPKDGLVEIAIDSHGNVCRYDINGYERVATAIEVPLHGNLVEGDAVLQVLIEELGDGSRYARIRDKLIDKVPVIVGGEE